MTVSWFDNVCIDLQCRSGVIGSDVTSSLMTGDFVKNVAKNGIASTPLSNFIQLKKDGCLETTALRHDTRQMRPRMS